MARVTYFDHERACPTTAFHGIEFEHKVPVTLDDNLHADTLDILEQNRFFKVEDRGKRQADPLISEPAKAREAGARAFRDGKPFSIPVRLRYNHAGEIWAAGYRHDRPWLKAIRRPRDREDGIVLDRIAEQMLRFLGGNPNWSRGATTRSGDITSKSKRITPVCLPESVCGVILL